MSWFNKKKVKEDKSKLPSLPKLPPLSIEEDEFDKPINQLPSFPNNSLGDKFSQNTIKEAVTGEKEGEWPEEEDYESPMIQEPKDYVSETIDQKRKTNQGPIYIRIDKFEEGLKIFDKTKEQIYQIEETLKNIKKTKEQEEQELSSWEEELQKIKSKIERVEKDLFSKLE